MKTILLVLCFCCITSAAFSAPTRNYDVQVLIFSHITPTTLQLQQWPLISTNNQNTQYSAPQHAYDLQREKKILQKNPNYQILLDASWPEAWHGDQSTINIPVSSSNNNSQLNGSITITLGHYFDVHTNLFLTEPMDALKNLDKSGYFSRINQSTFTFQLLQNRRMRSKELNYLEHPIIGMLIKIIPIKSQ